jgi:hypothetical protein
MTTDLSGSDILLKNYFLCFFMLIMYEYASPLTQRSYLRKLQSWKSVKQLLNNMASLDKSMTINVFKIHT